MCLGDTSKGHWGVFTIVHCSNGLRVVPHLSCIYISQCPSEVHGVINWLPCTWCNENMTIRLEHTSIHTLKTLCRLHGLNVNLGSLSPAGYASCASNAWCLVFTVSDSLHRNKPMPLWHLWAFWITRAWKWPRIRSFTLAQEFKKCDYFSNVTHGSHIRWHNRSKVSIQIVQG